MKKRNYRIDNIRLIMSVFVVLIHTTAFISLTEPSFLSYYSYRYILDMGVPFFFAVSGYYISVMSDEKHIKAIYTNLKVFVSISVFYLVVTIIEDFFKTGGGFTFRFRTSLSVLNQINPINILKGTFGCYHLWYFSSLIMILIFSYFFLKKNNSIMMLFVSVLMFLFFNVIVSDTILRSIFLRPLTGLISFSVGALVRYQKPKIRGVLLYSLIACVLYSVIRHLHLGHTDTILLFVALYLIMVFATSDNNDPAFIKNASETSTYIYLFHPWFIKIFEYFYSVVFRIDTKGALFIVLSSLFAIVMPYLLFTFFYKVRQYLKNDTKLEVIR